MKKETKRIGRPAHYATTEELEDKINEYFDTCEENKKLITYTGLLNHLGIEKSTFHDYSQKEKFSHSIKMAKQRIEEILEEQLTYRPTQVTGVIFNLKNNYGWQDKHEIDLSIKEYEVDMIEDED